MRKLIKSVLVLVMLMAGFAALYVAYIDTHKVAAERSQKLESLLRSAEKSLQLDIRVKSSHCQANGPLPDHECTPGAVFPAVTKEKICVTGYSKSVRNVSVDLKKKVFAEYGIKYPVPFGSYEIDHLIPLALGGNNDISNLWPKSAEPFPGFWEKNITGDYLKEEVCAGNVALKVAQQYMADNWFLIYQNMDPRVIEDLKLKYPSWVSRK